MDKCLLRWSFKFYNNWKQIKKRFLDKFGLSIQPKQLSNRHKLIKSEGSPTDGRVEFNGEHDVEIVQLTIEVGLKWDIIADKMGFCDSVRIKNRYYNYIKRFGRLEEIMSSLGIKK